MKRRFFVNAVVSAVQVIVVGGAFFLLYPFLLRSLGEDLFGVWAVVLATTSASAIANLGLAGSTLKFVAQYLARDEQAYVDTLIQTALLTIGGVLLVLLPLAYPLFRYILAFIITPQTLVPEAFQVLPYALTSFWLTTVATVTLSCLEGFQRIDLRGYLTMGTTALYLGLCFWLVPEQGLIGLARAQVIQAGTLCIGSWLLLRHLKPTLPVVPTHWSRRGFSEMLGYSINFQISSLAQLLFLPTTTALLSRLGGTGVVSYFEMANRMVVQLRALVTTAHRAIVPAIANLQERAPETIRQLYITSMRLLFFLVFPGLPFLIILTPPIAEIYVGGYNATFILYADLLLVGWFLNILSNPAYFANLGTGDLHWNVIGHLIMGVMNVGLGYLLGRAFGGTGVVFGFTVALLAGSAAVAIAYQRQHHLHLADLLDPASLRLGLASLFALGVAMLGYVVLLPSLSFFPRTLVVCTLYMSIIIIPLWRHPVRRDAIKWIRALFRPRASSSSPVEP